MTAASINLFDQARGRRPRRPAKEAPPSSVTPITLYQPQDQPNGKSSSKLSEHSGRKGKCLVHLDLLEEYNRMFTSWAAHEDERAEELDMTETERQALAQIEEAHQKLLRHQQSCPICQKRR